MLLVVRKRKGRNLFVMESMEMQIKYFILYDKNSLLNLVIELFMIYLNIESKEYFLEEYDLKLFVHQL